MMASLKLSKENTDVELMNTNIERSNYVAMAFSDDKKHGKDLVFACSPSWTTSECGVFWNKEGYENEQLTDKTELIENLRVREKSSSWGVNFSLPNQMTINGYKFDLEKGHYIFLSTGTVNEDKLTRPTKFMASTSKFGKKGNSEDNEPTTKSASDGDDGKKATGSITKAASDGDDGKKATGSATDEFLSGLPIAMMLFSFFLNA